MSLNNSVGKGGKRERLHALVGVGGVNVDRPPGRGPRLTGDERPDVDDPTSGDDRYRPSWTESASRSEMTSTRNTNGVISLASQATPGALHLTPATPDTAGRKSPLLTVARGLSPMATDLTSGSLVRSLWIACCLTRVSYLSYVPLAGAICMIRMTPIRRVWPPRRPLRKYPSS
jgi:hypothetical protein